MELCDKAALELFAAAAAENTDVFFLPSHAPSGKELVRFSGLVPGVTVCVFPREPVIPKNLPVGFFRNGVFSGEASAKLIFASADSLGSDEFSGFLAKKGCCRLLLAFAEDAAPHAGAHTRPLKLLGELRAELPAFVPLIAVFAGDIVGEERVFAESFGSRRWAVIGEARECELAAREFLSPSGVFYFAADECERLGTGRTAVFFNDRLNAESFASFMRRRGTDCPVFHGGRTYDEKRRALNDFCGKENGVIAATRAFLPSALFCDIAGAVFCGVPSDAVFARQIQSVEPGAERLVWAFSPDDIRRTAGSIYSYASFLPEDEKKDFLRLRLQALENILKTIK